MNRITHFLFVVLAIVVLSACSQNQPQPPIPDNDAVTVNLDTKQSFVNGKLSLQVDIEGEVKTVDILKNSEVFKTLTSPFVFIWDTSKEKEGTYTIQARVTQQDIYVSKPLTLTVDRTAPSLEEVTPLAEEPSTMYEQIKVYFSEAVDASTVNSSTIVLKYQDAVVPTTITLSEDKNSLTIEPQATTITLPATLNLRLQGIKDLAGNALALTDLSFEITRPVDFEGSLNQDIHKSVLTSVLSFDQSQNPVIFFSEGHVGNTVPTQLYVITWTSDGWQRLGEQINPVSSYAIPLQMVVSTNNYPMIAYQDYATLDDFINAETPQTVIKKWNGSSWQMVDTFADDSLGMNKLELQPSGDHILRIWEGDAITIKSWSGSSWTNLKTMPIEMSPVHEFAETYLYHTAIALDNDNNPVLAWFEDDYTDGKQSYVYVKRWNGTSWELLGEAVVTGTSVWWPEIMLKIDPDNRPVLAYTEVKDGTEAREIYLKRWDNGWQTLSTGSLNVNPASEALLSGLEFDHQANPILSWTEGNKAYASVWQDSKWQLLGDSSLNRDNQHEASAVVYANGQGTYYKTLSEKISDAFQLFVQPF